MQFSTILVALTAAMVSAAPSGNNPPPTNQCSQTQTQQCCESFTQTLVGPIIGVNCVNVLGSQCEQNQQLACCESDSIGLVNVGPVCPNLLVNVL